MEYFDVFDKDLRKLDKVMERGTSLNKGEYHKVVQIWIKNSNKYLIQQRNKREDRVPYQWALTSGAVLQGEEPLDSIIRETKEEIGLELQKDEIKNISTYFVNHHKSSFIMYVYFVEKDVKIEDLVIDKQEVKDVKYSSVREVKQMIRRDEFWNYPEQFEAPNYFKVLEKE